MYQQDIDLRPCCGSIQGPRRSWPPAVFPGPHSSNADADARDSHTLYTEENVGDPRWSNPEASDFAFTRLPENAVATLKATCIFLNWDRNMKKFADGEPARDGHVLVDEFSGQPVAENGLVTTPMKGVLTPGRVVGGQNGVVTMECMEPNIPDLPKSFGGTSGGGLWRMYLKVAADGSYEEVQTRFSGVASFQRNATHIICQSVQRIAQALVPAIRQQYGAWPL